MGLLLGTHGRRGVHEGLVLAGRLRATLDAQHLERVLHAVVAQQHPDRPDDAGLVHVDVVSRCRDVVAARGTDLLDHRMQRLFGMETALTPHLVDDHAGLNGASARAVDAQDHAHRTRIGKGATQGLVDPIGRDALLARAADDDPFDVDGRHIAGRPTLILLDLGHRGAALDAESQHRQECQPLEDAPAALCLALLQRLAREFLDEATTPFRRAQDVFFVLLCHAWPPFPRGFAASGEK